ncbi:MAG: excisionase family DNA-binding protein [Elusimicrobiota bacterium]
MAYRNAYTTLEGKQLPLAKLTAEERRFLGRLSKRVKEGVSYLDFENLYLEPSAPLYARAKRLGKPVDETTLYRVCEDMGKRLGIGQGYLLRGEVVESDDPEGGENLEMTTGQVAEMAGCTREGVRKAIRTGRLRARRLGRLSLIREEDAKAFAEVRGKTTDPER